MFLFVSSVYFIYVLYIGHKNSLVILRKSKVKMQDKLYLKIRYRYIYDIKDGTYNILHVSVLSIYVGIAEYNVPIV